MSALGRLFKQAINQDLNPCGLEITKLSPKQDLQVSKSEGFPLYVAEADRLGMDVNDWIEQVLGWTAALPILEKIVFPYRKDDAVVCELGSGVGRHARHNDAKLSIGTLYWVDHSPWMIAFLQKYFQENSKVFVHSNDGYSLPFKDNAWIDLIFSNGTFIELKLGLFYMYSREFFRVLKPNGYCVFDYIDPTTSDGYKYLESSAMRYGDTFTYHAPEVVDKVFSSAGFEIIERYQVGKSTYLIARKPCVGEKETNNDTK